MNSIKQTAHLAGALYLAVVITGIFGLMYVPSQIIVWSDPAATISNIMEMETLFRLGIWVELVCYTVFILLPLVLYRLLAPVNQTHAVLMVVFALISVPISFVAVLDKYAALTLLSGADYLSVFDAEQLQAQVMFHLRLYNNAA